MHIWTNIYSESTIRQEKRKPSLVLNHSWPNHFYFPRKLFIVAFTFTMKVSQFTPVFHVWGLSLS